jgi:hypothetical protein
MSTVGKPMKENHFVSTKYQRTFPTCDLNRKSVECRGKDSQPVGWIARSVTLATMLCPLQCKVAPPVKLPFAALPVTWLVESVSRLAPPVAWMPMALAYSVEPLTMTFAMPPLA